MAGINILQIRYISRWTYTSNMIDHYMRISFVSMPPEKLNDEVVCYRKKWAYLRLAYLARNMLEIGGNPSELHPHYFMLREHFPVFYG